MSTPPTYAPARAANRVFAPTGQPVSSGGPLGVDLVADAVALGEPAGGDTEGLGELAGGGPATGPPRSERSWPVSATGTATAAKTATAAAEVITRRRQASRLDARRTRSCRSVQPAPSARSARPCRS